MRNLCLSYIPSFASIEFSTLYRRLRSLAVVRVDDDELDDVVHLLQHRRAVGLPLEELKIAFDNMDSLSLDEDPMIHEGRTALQAIVPSVEFCTMDQSQCS